ncbi:MAG: nitrite reductase, copper-containing [Dehalococcoidia bacterium]|nr:nitrite reductase, copper-containing [Dehalococcoidia bacterium]
MPLRNSLRMGVIFLLVALGAVLSAACSDPAMPKVEAKLVAPPNVMAALPRTQSHVVVRLETFEQEVEIAPGVTYKMWTFNNTVPGPLIRAHVGDTVEIVLTNNGSSTVSHNIDLHAVNGPGGGAVATNVMPGETKSFLFKAEAAGLFTYHCAAGLVADHIANGMYGGILIEPREGLPKVDHEYYVGQSDMYTDGATGETGLQELDINKLVAEQPTYVVFNGNTKALAGDKALTAKVGDTVRIYFVDGGPNLTSSFHVIGEIFDKAWAWGTLESPPVKGVQTISVPPGGATIVEFKVTVPGDYVLVDHALGRVTKGASGILRVTGADNPDVFFVPGGGSNVQGGHDMSGTPTAVPEVEVSTGTIKVTMKDNVFEPKNIAVKANDTVTFDAVNVGKVPHNMRIATLTGDYDAAPGVVTTPEIVNAGKSGTIQWKVPAETGVYKFRCDIHPVDMTGTITVK